MPTFIENGINTTAQALAAGQIGVVTATGALVVTGAAVTVTGAANLQIAGLVHGTTFGIDATSALRVTIAASGVLSSGLNSALQINAATGTSNILNAGIIDGRAGGIIAAGSTVNLVNSGLISGSASTGVNLNVSSFGSLDNTGTISGTRYGVLAGGNGIVAINNTGTIQGGQYALDFFNGVGVTVRNTGELIGEVLFNVGNDLFNGAGGIQGKVSGSDGNDTLIGGSGDDVFDGGTGNDQLRGGAGEDELFGFSGSDLLAGGAGDDTLSGSAGNDVLNGGVGDDSLTGGTGVDRFLFGRGQGHDVVTDFQDGFDVLDLRAFGFVGAAPVLALSSATAAGVLMNFASFGGGTVILQGMTVAQLTAADFLL